jgi:hypothetical protein
MEMKFRCQGYCGGTSLLLELKKNDVIRLKPIINDGKFASNIEVFLKSDSRYYGVCENCGRTFGPEDTVFDLFETLRKEKVLEEN